MTRQPETDMPPPASAPEPGKGEERQLHAPSSTTFDIMGKRRTPATKDTQAEIARIMKLLKAAGWSNVRIGKELGEKYGVGGDGDEKKGLSAPGVRKWSLGTTPSDGNLAALRLLAADVERGLTKMADLGESPSREGIQTVTSVPSHSGREVPAVSGGDMGQVIRMRIAEIPGVRYPYLELALCYHVAELETGAVSLEVISLARGGRFESQGCQKWDAPHWWRALVDAEAQIARMFSEPGSGTHRAVAKTLKKPGPKSKLPPL